MSQKSDAGRPWRLHATRALLSDLRALGQAPAPMSIAGAALATIGLADWYTTLDTPLGLVYIAWNASGLTLARLAESDEAFDALARAELGREVVAGAPPQWLADGAQAWLAGEKAAPLKFDLSTLTPFERATLLKARDIPFGQVRPYGWIAREIGHPMAVRAVGTALARNPIPLFIPCHRVVRTDGYLGNYSMGGPQNKRAILAAEGVDITRLELLAAKGVRFIGNTADDSYCYPTCSFACHVDEAQMRLFHDEASALALGYHACAVCRPPAAQLAS